MSVAAAETDCLVQLANEIVATVSNVELCVVDCCAGDRDSGRLIEALRHHLQRRSACHRVRFEPCAIDRVQ